MVKSLCRRHVAGAVALLVGLGFTGNLCAQPKYFAPSTGLPVMMKLPYQEQADDSASENSQYKVYTLEKWGSESRIRCLAC